MHARGAKGMPLPRIIPYLSIPLLIDRPVVEEEFRQS
jgi:hypothetical protein